MITPNRAIGAKLGTTAQTTIYTVEDDNMVVLVRAIHVANVVANPTTITIEWTDASEADTFTITKSFSIQPNSTGLHLDADDGLGFEMTKDDSIKCTAGTANALHVILTIAEMGRSG